MKKYYITTAIDYTNDVIHMGHIFQKIVADVLARYHRIKIGEHNVFFLTGTDEYGQRIEKKAQEADVPTKEFVDKIAAADKEQQESLNISFNRFIRTTDPDHAKVVNEIWKRVEKEGDIYLGEYSGLYCEGCEAYYKEDELVNGCCLYHPTLEIKRITEKNYFFKWSKYRNFLIDHIKNNPDFVIPHSRGNEMLEFAKNIEDVPISRSSFKWGIPVPGDPSQVIYVWFDALINYLTGVRFLEDPKLFEKFWPADLHILGKDNARWHALLWPAMLKSAGIESPKSILVNGFIGLNGQKISKSLGNVIRPTDWVSKYGTDGVRYYILRYTTIAEDNDISEDKLLQAYNSDLANGLGNLVARVARLAENNNLFGEDSQCELFDEVEKFVENYKPNEALTYLWTKISEADKKINEERLWELEEEKAKPVLEDLVKRIQEIAFNLKPFLPQTSEKILTQFTGKIKSSQALFPRI